jgi:hypothetical protein
MIVLNENLISEHYQFAHGSCIPSMIEVVLKLEGIIDIDDFRFQSDKSKWWDSSWIDDLNLKNSEEKSLIFKRHFEEPRGSNWLNKFRNTFFSLIDEELSMGRFIIVIMNSGQGNYHPEIIYSKKKSYIYYTFTFHAQDSLNVNGMYKYEQDLFQRVIVQMEGTALYTYNRLS